MKKIKYRSSFILTIVASAFLFGACGGESAEMNSTSFTQMGEEKEYFAYTDEKLETMSLLLNDFHFAYSEFKSDRYSDQKLYTLAIISGLLQSEVDEWNERDIAVPEKYEQTHEIIDEAMRQYGLVFGNLPEALDDFDLERVDLLVSRLEEMNTTIYEAMNK